MIDIPGGPRRRGPLVQTYPVAPGARPSRSHRVRVLGRPVLVERHADVVANGQPIGDAATAERVANLTIGPHVRNLTFD